MKVLSLKLRGGMKGFRSQLKELITFCNLDLIPLLETKVHSDKANKIIKAFSFDNFLEIFSEGLL